MKRQMASSPILVSARKMKKTDGVIDGPCLSTNHRPVQSAALSSQRRLRWRRAGTQRGVSPGCSFAPSRAPTTVLSFARRAGRSAKTGRILRSGKRWESVCRHQPSIHLASQPPSQPATTDWLDQSQVWQSMGDCMPSSQPPSHPARQPFSQPASQPPPARSMPGNLRRWR